MSLVQIKSSNENLTEEKSLVNLDSLPSDAKIWLVDPTYTQQQVSSESMPGAIGGIATFTEHNLKLKNPIRLFKYPETLSNALQSDGVPNIIGFSNYMWNSELSLALARRIKEYAADTIIVMGGPNYPVDEAEQEKFIRKHPEIDFFIIGEGELAFANLIAALIRANLNKNYLSGELPSVHYVMPDGNAHISTKVERITDLSDIPSPYTTGKLDEFFDGKLQPVIQTTRGCPFTCTFCVEGMSYYSKIHRNGTEKIQDELNYIGSKMEEVRKKGGRNDLWLVDSNFGMYNQDLETCKIIAQCQEKFGWPEYIQCDTGKNNKAKVLDAAKLVKGAMRLSGSVQSLDTTVLKNIKRSNISGDDLMQLAVEASEIDADSRSEIILALPGESLESHFQTLRTVTDAGFNHVNTYQLMMLPGTEIDSPSTRFQYGLKTRFRILPRCYGYYDVLGKQIIAAEIEEVCISTNKLPFEDYVKCRVMHLIIHIYHNDGLFAAALKFINALGLSHFRWLELILDEKKEDSVKELFDAYEKDTRNELWLRKEELEQNIQQAGIIDSYLSGELGYNLLFVHKAVAMNKGISGLKKLAQITLQKLLIEKSKDSNENLQFINDALNFDAATSTDIFHNLNSVISMNFTYDIEKFHGVEIPKDISSYKLEKPKTINFILDDEQKDIIQRSLSLYGETDLGVSRVLTKVFVKKILRKPILNSQISSLEISKKI